MRMRALVAISVLGALAIAPFAAGPARADIVGERVYAENMAWHVGSNASTNTVIEANVGDTIHLRIIDSDPVADTSPAHTFTALHFPAAQGQGGDGSFLNVTLEPGATFYWNYTFVAADQGTWQFYCAIHSAGQYPSRTGMVGSFVISAGDAGGGGNGGDNGGGGDSGGGGGANAFMTPAFQDALIVVGVLIGIAVAAQIVARRRKKEQATADKAPVKPADKP